MNLNARLGLFVVLLAVLLALLAIPNWISSPSNVSNIVLSPVFWPYILSALLALIGIGLLVSSPLTATPAERDVAAGSAPWLRLAALALIMVATLFGLSTLGMVWTSMLTLLVTALLFRTRYPKSAVICAVLLPLVLYAFFAHVAGVAIPQGNFVRLP